AGPRVLVGGPRPQLLGHRVAHRVHGVEDHVLLRREVAEQAAGGHARRARHLLHRRLVEPVLCEQLQRELGQLGAHGRAGPLPQPAAHDTQPTFRHRLSNMSLTDRTVVVTGGTGGIGKEIARALAGLGARVIVTGRDPHRAATVVDELRVGTGNPAVDAVCADITRQRDLRALARAVTDRCGSLYALVNNAGVNPARRELTEDGVETAFAGNVLAPYLLTRLLLPALERTRRAGGGVAPLLPPAGRAPRRRHEPAHPQAEKAFRGRVTDTHHHRPNLAMMAMTRTLAQRDDAAGVAAVVAYPGHAHTQMTRSLPLGAY